MSLFYFSIVLLAGLGLTCKIYLTQFGRNAALGWIWWSLQQRGSRGKDKWKIDSVSDTCLLPAVFPSVRIELCLARMRVQETGTSRCFGIAGGQAANMTWLVERIISMIFAIIT